MAHARIGSLSLFGGAVTAHDVSTTIGHGKPVIEVAGLRIDGRPVRATAGRAVLVHGWGRLIVGTGRPDPTTGGAIAALALHLIQSRFGLPAGTALLVSVAGVPAKAEEASAIPAARVRARAQAPHRRHTHRPLTVTPPLAGGPYTFPLVGSKVSFGDGYGAVRNDVAGNWHHGDDIFAALGTPVVAVASGTINRVGWNAIGGWRIWVRDSSGDEFYYAHLSGYSTEILHSNRVRAGEVIGFVGNTGDAFTTSPHLHFEVHPRSLLHLGYDGAVDPTSYLEHWQRLDDAAIPHPALPALPAQAAVRQEARYVWRELLTARHLIRRPPRAKPRATRQIAARETPWPTAARPVDARNISSVRPRADTPSTPAVLITLLAALAACIGFFANAAKGSPRSRSGNVSPEVVE